MDTSALCGTLLPKPKGKDKLNVSKGCTPAVNFSTSARGFPVKGDEIRKREKELCRSSFAGSQPLATHKCHPPSGDTPSGGPWSSSCASA